MTDQILNSLDGMSLKELIQKMREWVYYLKARWLAITVIGILGAFIGYFYASMQPTVYTAKTTFVVEEGKGGMANIGGLASLAGQFGVDVGGGAGNGVLSGDNIILYFKSPSLAREVLLTQYDSLSTQSVADVYAKVYKLKDKWQENKEIGSIIFLPITVAKSYTRIQDSLLQTIIDDILKKQFIVAKTDRKAGFVDVSAIMEDEGLAKIYCERIVERAVERYINTKVQRQKETVDKLQLRADSIASLLRQKTISAASLQTSTSTMDINPLYKTGSAVATETTARDKGMLSAIFASVAQNLELAKFTLSQETPVIQIVDSPMLPLIKNRISRLKMTLSFSIVFSIALILFFVGKRIFGTLLD